MDRVNVHIYPSPLTNESRMLKITGTIKDANIFSKIFLVGVGKEDLPEREDIDDVRTIIRIRRRIGGNISGPIVKTMMTFEWTIRVILALRKFTILCVNCHSLPVLPLCLVIKWMNHAKLVYDTHELETETHYSQGIRKLLSKYLEQGLIRFIDEISCVNHSIADWYKNQFNLPRAFVVHNVPHIYNGEPPKRNYLRELFTIPDDHFLFLYLGSLSVERGVENLLTIFMRISETSNTKHILFIGFGELVDRIKTESGTYSNIHYHPTIKPEEIPEYTSQADIGIHIMENSCLNHYLAAPNKVWEYLNAGLPVIISDFPEMRKIVNQFNCGWTCEPTQDAAFKVIYSITRQDFEQKRAGVIVSKKSFGWHLEEPALLDIYKSLGFLEDTNNTEKRDTK